MGNEDQCALEISNLRSGYGKLVILHGVTLVAKWSSVTTIIGLNGAGKTTLARTISGMTDIKEGNMTFDGVDFTSRRPSQIARLGILQVYEDRELFANLSVKENLTLGYTAGRRRTLETKAAILDSIYELLPRLFARREQVAGTMSGGEQQMLALGRALACQPRFLILDEPSTGLAPAIVDEMYEALLKLREGGLAMLLIEQDIERALEFADYAYVLTSGSITTEGVANEIAKDSSIGDLLFAG